MRNFGLIGYPLKHSFSKSYFEKKFNNLNIKDSSYTNFEIKNIEDFKDIISNNSSIIGLNVTIPYKESIMKLLDEIDQEAAEIGSVNVIKFQNKKLKGFNTDYLGFQKSLIEWLPDLNFSALVLGSGGSSNAVCYSLKKLKIPYKIVSRFSGVSKISYDELLKNEDLINYKLIINTTPLGMYPNIDSIPNLNFDQLTSNHYVFDLVYNPEETKLLSTSKSKGSKIKNGYDMLVNQAELSWEIWNK